VEGVYHAKRASLRLNQDRNICFRCALTSAEVAGCSAPSAFFPLVESGSTHRSRRALTPAQSWPGSASSGLYLRSNRDRRNAPSVRLLRPNRGLAPHQAVCLFGQIATDAILQACAYSGPIVASHRIKRFVSSVTTISDRLGARAPQASAPRLSLTAPKATSETRPPSKAVA
jgi:hypothetical protein